MKSNGRLELRDDVPEPVPRADELLVKVEAISLNRGEVRAAALAADGVIPGWDVAGTLPDGTRVALLRADGTGVEIRAGDAFADVTTIAAREWGRLRHGRMACRCQQLRRVAPCVRASGA